jgi:indole-3-glycerol phosphate synthase
MILDEILAHKRLEVEAAKSSTHLADLKARIAAQTPVRGFSGTLRARAAAGIAVIAEVKKGSPSKGIICTDFDPVAIARAYQAGGAACLSVLTDKRFFFGHLGVLEKVRAAVALPLLRKDFIIDPYQLYEARACGADAVLLIVSALSEDQLKDLTLEAETLQLEVLTEIHDEMELEVALNLGARLIGINNRNLKTFQTDLAVTEKLLPLIPADCFVVSESGINCRTDIDRLLRAGAKGFLVGESLMREKDRGSKLTGLLAG